MPSNDTSDRPVLTLIAGAPCSGRNRWGITQANRLPKTVYGTEDVRNEHGVNEQGLANWTQMSIVTDALTSTDVGIRAWAYRSLTGKMEEQLQTGRSFGLRTTLANDPLAEKAVTAARAAGYRVHCHFIGTDAAQLNAGRARTSRTDVANNAAALWHMARERLAATADQYDVIELVRSQNDEQVTTHRFEGRTETFRAEAYQRRGADDALAAAITGSKTSRRKEGKSDRKPTTPTTEPDQAEELLQDIASWATERVEGRSVWHTWTSEARPAEEIRIALGGRGLEGWYVQVPLDSDGMPYGVVASLRCSNAEPDADSNVEVPLNLDATVMLEQLYRCVRKPR